MTELEGALLCEIRRRKVCTAYEMRRAFEKSSSLEWSGSTGAVYPAIKRLTQRGFITAEQSKDDARGTNLLSLSKEGMSAVHLWSTDIDRAIGPGFDPFRTRSIEWTVLPPAKLKIHAAKLERALTARIEELEKTFKADNTDTRVELDLALQRSRLVWLRRTLLD